jgi:hypothetical protein
MNMQDTSSSFLQGTPDAIASRLMQKAHLRDGLPEILVGLLFLLAAGFNFMSASLPRASTGLKIAFLADIGLFVVLSVGTFWLLKWVRRQFLVEREGYVRQKTNRPKLARILVGGLIVFFLVLYAALFMRLPNMDNWVLAGTGLYVGAIWAFIGRSRRFVVSGLLDAVTGIALAFARISVENRLGILFTVMGIVALLSGCVVFVRFIRQPREAGE